MLRSFLFVVMSFEKQGKYTMQKIKLNVKCSTIELSGAGVRTPHPETTSVVESLDNIFLVLCVLVFTQAVLGVLRVLVRGAGGDHA